MGLRGPVPSRDADLARPRSRKGSDQQETTFGVARPATIPTPDPEWHPIALMLWDALLESGQSDYFQSSDWVFAYSLCEDLTRYKEPLVNRDGEEYFKRSGQMLQVLNAAMADLLVTDAHRRRVRLELAKPTEESTPAAVIAIADYQAGLGLATND